MSYIDILQPSKKLFAGPCVGLARRSAAPESLRMVGRSHPAAGRLVLPRRTSRWGSVTPFLVAGLLLVAGLVWRMQSPGAPLSPLATRALELHAAWRAGQRSLDPDAAPAGLPAFARWATGAAATNRLTFIAPGPRVPWPWVGAAIADVEGVTAAVSGHRAGTDDALVLVVPEDRPEVLGPLAGHMVSEWSRYDYATGERRLMIWRRGGLIFAMVTTRSFEEAGAWLPAPGARFGEAVQPSGPPGSRDPTFAP